MKDYILFIPPVEVSEKKPREWSANEARLYFNWFMSVKDDRVEYMLTAIDETLTNNSLEDIKRIGETITNVLSEEPFSENIEGELIITNRGLALVADLSLLISKLIIKDYTQITWKIVKRPLRDISYNLPAMFGFPLVGHRELIGAAIMNAKAILRGERDSSIWLKMYQSAIDLINGNTE